MTPKLVLEFETKDGDKLFLDGEISDTNLSNIISHVIAPTFNKVKLDSIEMPVPISNTLHTFKEEPRVEEIVKDKKEALLKNYGKTSTGEDNVRLDFIHDPVEYTPEPGKAIPIENDFKDLVGHLAVPNKRLPMKVDDNIAPFTPKMSIGSLGDNMDTEQLAKLKESLTFSTDNKDEGIKEEDREADYWRTGIKYKGPKNLPAYKLGYDCPKCGTSGRHYIPDFAKTVTCHKCLTSLLVESATHHGFGVGDKYRDAHGNFFVARVMDTEAFPFKA